VACDQLHFVQVDQPRQILDIDKDLRPSMLPNVEYGVGRPTDLQDYSRASSRYKYKILPVTSFARAYPIPSNLRRPKQFKPGEQLHYHLRTIITLIHHLQRQQTR